MDSEPVQSSQRAEVEQLTDEGEDKVGLVSDFKRVLEVYRARDGTMAVFMAGEM